MARKDPFKLVCALILLGLIYKVVVLRFSTASKPCHVTVNDKLARGPFRRAVIRGIPNSRPKKTHSVAEEEETGPPFDVLVVGAGLSGAVIAERHATVLGKRVLVVEKRNHIGGNCYDYLDPDTGIRVNKYGAHLFHTSNEEVWNYIRKFGRWDAWEHRVLAWVKSKYVPVPVNINTVNMLFNLSIQNSRDMNEWLAIQQINPANSTFPRNSEEMALSRVGRDLYELIFKPYTEKQWNTSASHLGPEVTGRIPVRDNWDDRYFSDKYQVLPANGYTDIFHAMLSGNPLIEVHTSTDYFDLPLKLRSRISPSTKIFYTGPIDKFFSSEKRLEYRSLEFLSVVQHNQPGYYLPAPVVNFPGREFLFTRVVEYKHMLNQSSGSSVLYYEFPSDKGEPYYPVPTAENKALYHRLVEMTRNMSDITFVGRLANYKYFNMDEAISNALHVFRNASLQTVADIHVITSIFHEDLSWQETLCNQLGGKKVRWFVFDKGENSPTESPLWTLNQGDNTCVTLGWYYAPLPNVGREGHSWITYIQNGVFANTNVFIQGKPEGLFASSSIESILKHVLDGGVARYVPISSSITCAPAYDPYFDMDFFHEHLCKISMYLKIPLETMCHSYRGEFIASREALEYARTKHAEFIGSVILAGLESGNDPPMGHALERSWLPFLDPPRPLN